MIRERAGVVHFDSWTELRRYLEGKKYEDKLSRQKSAYQQKTNIRGQKKQRSKEFE
jgi:hypothetical protein